MCDKTSSPLKIICPGVVSKPSGQMEKKGEVLGAQQCDGRVRPVWSHGPPFHPAARVHPQVSQGGQHRLLRAVVTG